MGFKDLSELFNPYLDLPIRGKVYRIPSASAADGLRLRQLLATGGVSVEDEQREALQLLGAHLETETVTVPTFDFSEDAHSQIFDDVGEPFMREVEIEKWVGGIYDEMSADGITMDEIIHAGITALTKAAFGLERAERYWETGLVNIFPAVEDAGKSLAPAAGPNRATRRAAKSPAKKVATKKATSSKAGTGSTTRAQARTAKTTPAARTSTP